MFRALTNEKRAAVEKHLGRKLKSGESFGVVTGRAPASREQKLEHDKFINSLKPVKTQADKYREYIEGQKKVTADELRQNLLAKMEAPPADENPRVAKYHAMFDEIGHCTSYSEAQYLHLERMRTALAAGNNEAFDSQIQSLRLSIKESIEQAKANAKANAEQVRADAERLAANIERQGTVFGIEQPKVAPIMRDEKGRPIIEGGLPPGIATVAEWEFEQQKKQVAMALVEATDGV